MRSLVFSLALLAGVATLADAQRPSITRPIQQAREAAAKSGARTATAEAAGQEPTVTRDSVPVTSATMPTATKSPSTASPATKAPTTAPSTAKSPAAKSPATENAAPASANNAASVNGKAPVTGAASGTAAVAVNGASASDKGAAVVPPPQVAAGRTPPAGSKAPVKDAPLAKPAGAASDAPAPDSSAKTISVGSLGAPTRPELRIDREVFAYDAGGRRDPFVSLFSTSDLRPLFSDLLLVVINYDPQRRNSVAIMRDAKTNEQYRVRQGQLIGRMRVAGIEPKRVLFTIDEFGFSRQETLVIGDTTKVRKQ